MKIRRGLLKLSRMAPMAAFVFNPLSGLGSDPGSIRKSALAGEWFPADPQKLKKRIDLYLDRVGEVRLSEKPLGLIVPHAGYIYSGQAAAYGYKAVENLDFKRVVIMGLSHQIPLNGAAVPGADFFETPLGIMEVDKEACGKLLKSPLFKADSQIHAREHSIEIQLPFLQVVLKKGFKIVPLAVGSLRPKDVQAMADEIKKILGPDTLLVASSDFTHYGRRFDFVPSEQNIPSAIEQIDKAAIKNILAAEADGFFQECEKTGATICGRNPISVLLKALPSGAKGTLLRYYRSGDITGDWESSVSYASILFSQENPGQIPPPVKTLNSEFEIRQKEMLSASEQKELISLARKTIETYVKEKKVFDVTKLKKPMSEGLKKNLGVFVTLKEKGDLRGCIGTIQGQEPLFKGVIDNAINSCARDSRFLPVTPDELDDIHIEISVLSPLKEVSTYENIVPGWHGVLLQKGPYQAVFLPQVPLEQGWDLEEMLSNLSMKAGLGKNEWKSGARFLTFEAQIFSEEK